MPNITFKDITVRNLLKSLKTVHQNVQQNEANQFYNGFYSQIKVPEQRKWSYWWLGLYHWLKYAGK